MRTGWPTVRGDSSPFRRGLTHARARAALLRHAIGPGPIC